MVRDHRDAGSLPSEIFASLDFTVMFIMVGKCNKSVVLVSTCLPNYIIIEKYSTSIA